LQKGSFKEERSSRENRRMNQKKISEGETLGNNLISLPADQSKAV